MLRSDDFGVGDVIIDTKKQCSAEIIGVLEPGKNNVSRTIYILEDSDFNLYIQDDDHVIEYNKDFFD